MKKAGVILVCLQAIVIISGISNGTITDMLSSGIPGLFELLGFCLFGIIGIILLIKSNKKADK